MSDDTNDNDRFYPIIISLDKGSDVNSVLGNPDPPQWPEVTDQVVLDFLNNDIRSILGTELDIDPNSTYAFFTGKTASNQDDLGSTARYFESTTNTNVNDAILAKFPENVKTLNDTTPGKILEGAAESFRNNIRLDIDDSVNSKYGEDAEKISELLDPFIKGYSTKLLLDKISSGDAGDLNQLRGDNETMGLLNRLAQADQVTGYAWRQLSYDYASAVDGKVIAIVGDKVNSGNILETVEVQRMLARGDVHAIDFIDRTELIRVATSGLNGATDYGRVTSLLRDVHEAAADFAAAYGNGDYSRFRELSIATGATASALIRNGADPTQVKGIMKGDIPAPDMMPRFMPPEFHQALTEGTATPEQIHEISRMALIEVASRLTDPGRPALTLDFLTETATKAMTEFFVGFTKGPGPLFVADGIAQIVDAWVKGGPDAALTTALEFGRDVLKGTYLASLAVGAIAILSPEAAAFAGAGLLIVGGGFALVNMIDHLLSIGDQVAPETMAMLRGLADDFIDLIGPDYAMAAGTLAAAAAAAMTGTILLPGAIIVALASLFSRASIDPVVLDLGGNGVTLTPLATSHASFDLHGTGFAVSTGWVGADDGFLVVDRNGDGIVNNISELFGNSEIGGFAALSTLDSNHDGIVDARDPGFSSLKLWVDADGDGKTDASELKSLTQYGIIAINLAATTTDHVVNGNMIGALGSYVKSNGTTGEVAEAYFDNNTALSHYDGNFTYDPEVWALPNARGYGTVPDLWIAMSLDPTLKAMVQGLAARALDDKDSFQATVLQIIYRWTGVENVAAGSRGSQIDAQHLAVLEKFVGQSYDFQGNSDPIYSHQGEILEQAFSSLVSAISARLIIFGPLHDEFKGTGYDFVADSFVMPDGANTLADILALDAPADLATAAQFWEDWGNSIPLLQQLSRGVGLSDANMHGQLQAAFDTLHLPFTLDQATYGRVFIGTATNDALTGTFAGDHLQGLAGDDAMTGGQGDDTYYFKRGDGNDRIADQGAASDKLVLAGVTPGDLRVIQHADKLILLIDDGSGGRIDLTDQFSDKGGVESVHFGDGTVWSEADLLAHAVSSDGTIVTHLGTTDDDTIAGSMIGDLVEGRAGDDDLAGGTGDDTYLFYRGDGNDRITEESSGGKADRLVLHGIAPDAVTLSASGNDVVVTIAESAAGRGDGGTVTLTDELLSGNYAGIDAIVFDDGTTWAPTGIDVWLAHGEMNANVAYNLVLDNILDSLATAPETVTPAALDALNVLLPALTQFATDDLGPFLRGLLEDGVAPLLTGDFASLGPALVEAVHNLGPVVDGTGTLLLPATGQTLDLLIPAVSHFLFADVVPALAQKLIVHGLIPATTADHADIAALLTDSFAFLVPAVSQAADTLLPAATHVVADDVLPVVGGLLTDAIAPALSGELNSLEPTLSHLAGNLGTVVAGIGDTLVPALGDVVDDLLPATAGFLDQALPVVGTIVADTLVPALTGGAAGPQAAADDLFDFAVPAVTGIVDAVAPPVTDLVTGSVLPVVSDILVDGIAPILSGNLNGLGTTVVDAVETLVPAAVETVAEVVTGLGSHVSSFLKNLLSPQHADHFHFL